MSRPRSAKAIRQGLVDHVHTRLLRTRFGRSSLSALGVPKERRLSNNLPRVGDDQSDILLSTSTPAPRGEGVGLHNGGMRPYFRLHGRIRGSSPSMADAIGISLSRSQWFRLPRQNTHKRTGRPPQVRRPITLTRKWARMDLRPSLEVIIVCVVSHFETAVIPREDRVVSQFEI